MVSRALSATFKRQLFTPFRDKDYRVLLSIDHATFAAAYRFVAGDPNEFETLTSNGVVYQTFPFEITLLSDDEQDPEATIRIQNVDDRIGSTILGLPDDAVSVTMQVVLRETPDVVEYEAAAMELVDVEISALFVQGRLTIRGQATEPCPGRVLSSRISPVFFR